MYKDDNNNFSQITNIKGELDRAKLYYSFSNINIHTCDSYAFICAMLNDDEDVCDWFLNTADNK